MKFVSTFAMVMDQKIKVHQEVISALQQSPVSRSEALEKEHCKANTYKANGTPTISLVHLLQSQSLQDSKCFWNCIQNFSRKNHPEDMKDILQESFVETNRKQKKFEF